MLSVTGGNSIECITSPHSHGSVDVSVTVAGIGNAVGSAMFEYQLEVTGVSKCTGFENARVPKKLSDISAYPHSFFFDRSFLGGHLIIISGKGFGTDSENLDISINSVSCAVKVITDTEIKCLTGSTATTHLITNNA